MGTNFIDGGDCATCHTGTWAGTHTTDPGHTGITVGATGCADCHTDTLVSAATDTHNACTSCHDTTSGALIGAAVGNPTPTDCTTCHTGTWAGTHTTDPGHTGITVGATSCASCHSDTPFIDPGDTTNHNACVSCHDTASGALTGSAVGNPTPTDCATCHTGTWDALHTNHGHTVALGAADLSGGTSCGTCHTAANWTEIDTKHNIDTNGAGSCATCHNSARQEVIDAIALAANPTNCLPCHTDKSIPHAAHITAGYVTVGGVQDYYGTTCASCHDTGGTVNETVDITHGGDCSLCHTTVPNLQPTVPAGGGDCVTCHTGSVHTLWDRYQSSCGTAACHNMNGGPGNAMHDLHNAGNWSDRNSATSGMIYPYGTNPEMWITNWPLNPDCSTCHAPIDANPRGGCGNCHAFPGKGDLHARHSDSARKGGMEISCQSCH